MGDILCVSLSVIDDIFHANVRMHFKTVKHMVASEIVFAKHAKNLIVMWLTLEGALHLSIKGKARDKAGEGSGEEAQ